MCGNMADIQSLTAQIRRGKKEQTTGWKYTCYQVPVARFTRKLEHSISFFNRFVSPISFAISPHARPIWTIMVAAKVDQSRVLVTKFRENRLTLKGISAGQRHTHTDRQTWLKISALQVCNRANRNTAVAYTVLAQRCLVKHVCQWKAKGI